MRLEELQLTANQISALEKKKVVSVEALLRRPPLHYYNFSRTYPLDIDDERSKEMFNNNRPFAVSGQCISYTTGLSGKSRMVKIRIQDEITQNILLCNVIGYDLFRQAFLDYCKESPHRAEITLPSNISPYFTGTPRSVNPTCQLSSSITLMNVRQGNL